MNSINKRSARLVANLKNKEYSYSFKMHFCLFVMTLGTNLEMLLSHRKRQSHGSGEWRVKRKSLYALTHGGSCKKAYDIGFTMILRSRCAGNKIFGEVSCYMLP